MGMLTEEKDSNSWIYTNKKVDRPQELAGQRMATYAAMQPWCGALGMTYLPTPGADRYTAIERGLADGSIVSLESGIAYSLHEVCDYFIDHGAYGGIQCIVVNSDSFNSLPEHLQQLVKDVAAEAEANAKGWADTRRAEVKQTFKDQGFTFITFSPEDAKYFVDLAYKSRWEDLYEKYPDEAPVMHQFLEGD